MPDRISTLPGAAAPRRRAIVVDALLGAVVVWVLWIAAQISRLSPDGQPPWWQHGHVGPGAGPPFAGFTPWWWPLPFAVLCGVGVALRRRTPRAGFVLIVAGAAGYLALGTPVPPGLLGPVLGVHALAGRLPPRRWPVYAVVLLALPIAALAGRPAFGLTDLGTYGGLLFGASVLVVSALLALLRRNRREVIRSRRDEELRHAAYAERLRLAREVHDIVGHSLSVISMQAGVALHVLDARPQQARVSLEAIRASSRDALAELRHALGVFRDDAPDGPRTPAPGLARVDDLAAALRGAGRTVTVRRDIPAGAVIPAGLQQNAFRIVQEALTNVVRHTEKATATVDLVVEDDHLVISVTDDGPVLPGPVAEGNGLHGMRERVASVGGTLEIRAGTHGGLQVLARLPLPVDSGDPAQHEPCGESR